jgi:DNA repair protein RadC
MTHVPIKCWPAHERPRERLLKDGATGLSDAELLALVLGSGQRGLSAVDTARRALAAFGDLGSLLAADVRAHRHVRSGFGPARVALLKATHELAKRALSNALQRGESFDQPAALAQFFKLSLAQRAVEVFAVIALDSRLRKLGYIELFQGTLDRTQVHVAEVVRFALAQRASNIVVAHNHPSGSREASRDDVELTKRLQQALALVDVRLVDHYIVADGEPVSMQRTGHFSW